MAILEEEVWVGLNPQLTLHFENLGYQIPKYKDVNGIIRVKKGTKILVRVEDLTDNSFVRLTKKCEICDKKIKTNYHKIIKSRKSSKDGIDRCKQCANRNNIELINKNILEFNNVAMVNTEFATLFWDERNAHNYSCQSNKKTDFKCPLCKSKIKNKRVQDVYKYGLSCSKCSDGYSYSEKFTSELLSQLKVDFETHKLFKWSEQRLYDFYIPSLNSIIEAHGIQHYLLSFSGGRTLQEEQENDRLKEKLAIENGIKNYIVVDCRESNLNHLRTNIASSKLNSILDLENVDWNKCHEVACGSMVKLACELWNSGLSVKEISSKLKIERHTVVRYLKKGVQVNWCIYNPYSRRYRAIIQLSMDGEFIQEFESVSSAERSTNAKNISNACKGRQKTAGGYKWIYKEDYTKHIGLNGNN